MRMPYNCVIFLSKYMNLYVNEYLLSGVETLVNLTICIHMIALCVNMMQGRAIEGLLFKSILHTVMASFN